MELAELASIVVPSVRLERVLYQDVYLIERFDRLGNEKGYCRLPFILGLTILGAHESESSRQRYGGLADQLRRSGSEQTQDLPQLCCRMVFNILCSNNDDHLPNHGFLWNGRGWRLSPGYDIVSFPQMGTERDLVTVVGRSERRATVENALSNIVSFGLSRSEGISMLRKCKRL